MTDQDRDAVDANLPSPRSALTHELVTGDDGYVPPRQVPLSLRLATARPRTQYLWIVAVGLAIMGAFWMGGYVALESLLEPLIALILFPLFVHRLRESPGNRWNPSSSDGRLRKLIWDLRLTEAESRSGEKRHVGALMEAPEDLDRWLPSSFEPVHIDQSCDLWISAELRALIVRDRADLTLEIHEDDAAWGRRLGELREGGRLGSGGTPS